MKGKLTKTILQVAAVLAASSCISHSPGDLTDNEISLIRGTDSIMRVLTICDPADLAVLRAPSIDFSAEALMSDDYASLCSLLVKTVTHPSQDGVGIAGPQVGLNRRVVAVQRFDKAGEPFEVYPNISIIWTSDSLAYGPEGCLSVPDRRGDVLRSQEIVIEYAQVKCGAEGSSGCTGADCTARQIGQPETGDLSETDECPAIGQCQGTDNSTETGRCQGTDDGPAVTGQDGIIMVRDTVKGFTAVIFQHEIDHLHGVLYIDRL